MPFMHGVQGRRKMKRFGGPRPSPCKTFVEAYLFVAKLMTVILEYSYLSFKL